MTYLSLNNVLYYVERTLVRDFKLTLEKPTRALSCEYLNLKSGTQLAQSVLIMTRF
jgi:hypothetical protein